MFFLLLAFLHLSKDNNIEQAFIIKFTHTNAFFYKHDMKATEQVKNSVGCIYEK